MTVPPRWLFRVVTRATDGLAKLRRRLLPSPFAALDLGTSSWVAFALTAFCELELAPLLQQNPRSVPELSADCKADEAMLRRLLLSLCAYDVVRYTGNDRFALAHVGRGLVGEDALSAMVRYANASWHAAAYARLAEGIRSGRSGFDVSHNEKPFEYLRQDPQAAALFDAAMESIAHLYAPPFAHAYRFSGFESVVDVGGGTGVLLAALLERFPNLHGTLFELPASAKRARERPWFRRFAGRFDTVEGDILSQSPPAADVYILSHVLHDWDDESCVRMLRNICDAAKPPYRVLVYEVVMRAGDGAWSQDRLTDLEMMAMLPGRERTQEEFAQLFERVGLRLHRIIPAAAAESILEAVPSARRRG